MVKVKFKRLEGGKGLTLPAAHSLGAAGVDLHASVDAPIILRPGERRLIPTGLELEFPEGFVALVVPRSGLAVKQGISIVNSPGTIDSDYRGEVGVILINLGSEDFTVRRNDRIAQLLFLRCEQAVLEESMELSRTKRGLKGFGSSGK